MSDATPGTAVAATPAPVAVAAAANSPDLFAAYAVNEQEEKEGVLVPLTGAGDTLFRIARTGNEAYGKLFRKLYKKNERTFKAGGDAGEKAAIQMEIDLLATTVLLGWQGTVNVKGQMLPYSEANARMLLEHKLFRKAVKDVSESEEAYKLVKEEEIEGN